MLCGDETDKGKNTAAFVFIRLSLYSTKQNRPGNYLGNVTASSGHFEPKKGFSRKCLNVWISY